jgi:hypothetical protein
MCVMCTHLRPVCWTCRSSRVGQAGVLRSSRSARRSSSIVTSVLVAWHVHCYRSNEGGEDDKYRTRITPCVVHWLLPSNQHSTISTFVCYCLYCQELFSLGHILNERYGAARTCGLVDHRDIRVTVHSIISASQTTS